MPSGGAQAAGLSSEHKPFGKTNDGTAVEQYVLRNSHGMQATVITYGGVLQSLKVPDKHGKVEDVVLGFDDVQGYQAGTAFFGATIGRFGNRLAGGAFELDGKRYQVPLNDGPNALHGGAQGFDKHVWTATPVTAKDSVGVTLTYLSKDGEMGFPGNLKTTITSQNIFKNAINAANPGSNSFISLMHDVHETTVYALVQTAITALKAKGFAATTVGWCNSDHHDNWYRTL